MEEEKKHQGGPYCSQSFDGVRGAMGCSSRDSKIKWFDDDPKGPICRVDPLHSNGIINVQKPEGNLLTLTAYKTNTFQDF